MLEIEVLEVFEETPVLMVALVFHAETVHEVLLADRVPMDELVLTVTEVWKVLLVLLDPTASQVSQVIQVLTVNVPLVTVFSSLDTLKLLLIHLVQLEPRRFGMVSPSCT
jgi:hypothetical protein